MIKPRTPPYEGTDIPPLQSKLEIDKLLSSYGITKIAWDFTLEENRVSLVFQTEIDFKGVIKEIAIQIVPPLMERRARVYDRHQGKLVITKIPDWTRSMRLMFWYLDSKLKAIAWGLESVDHEFLSQVMIKLQDGTSRTMGDVLTRAVERGQLQEVARVALEDRGSSQ